MTNMKVFLELIADSRRLQAGMKQGERSVTGFARKAKADMASIRNAVGTLQGKLAGLGVTIGATALMWQSAGLDKSLTQIGQTAGASARQVKDLRKDLFRMGKESGQSVDSLREGFDVLVQTGLSMKEAKGALTGINQAMAITGASADTLAMALSVAANAYNFDLTKPEKAVEILEKMTVAGRMGNAELNKLSSLIPRIAVNATSAGMSFEKTLAFLEALSTFQPEPEKLGTLGTSVLRVFTDVKYMKKVEDGIKVKFFDKNQARRDIADVINDMKKKYQSLKTDQQRSQFIGKAFGEMDTESRTGIELMLKNAKTMPALTEIERKLYNVSGTFKRDMSEATANLVDQAGRLKAAMREAADGFSQPITKALADLIAWSMEKGEEAKQYTPDWKQIGGGAATLGTLALLAKKFGLGKYIKGKLGNAAGIAEGKAVQAASGVTPVFVTNWNDSGSGSSGILEAVGAGATARTAVGGLAKIAAVAAPFLGPVSIALGAVAAAGGLVYWIKSIQAERAREFADSQQHFFDWMNQLQNQKNEINLSVRIDESGRVVANSNDMNTHLVTNLWRGGF